MYAVDSIPFKRRTVRVAADNLGQWEAIVGTVATSLLRDSEKKSNAANSPAWGSTSSPTNITVSPSIQTQVSPQISPVFQQAWQPQGPMVGGTSQTQTTPQTATTSGAAGSEPPYQRQPYMPDTSAYPMSPASPLDAAYASPGAQMYASTPSVFWARYGNWIIGGVAAAGLLIYLKKRRRAPEYQHAYSRELTR